MMRLIAWHTAYFAAQRPPSAPSAPPAAPAPAPWPGRLDDVYVPGERRVREVRAGEDLQAAIDAAQPGDTLVLQAGATYRGPIRLPKKEGDAPITITSSGAARLPGPGGRVGPQHAADMARIVAPGRGEPAIATAPGAHHYRLVGLELTQAEEGAVTHDLVRIGAGDASQSRLDQVPHDILIDRCYMHGLPGTALKRGIALNGANVTITGSHLAGFKGRGYDTQAICGWNGPGPFTIVNNFLEGAGENVLFGGADPSIPGLVPSDITIRDNHFHKPLEWRGVWTVKNLFELKNARRVTVENNLFENNWADGQNGHAILFTVRNQDGGAPWSVVEDVRFANNTVRRSGSGVNVLGTDDIHPSARTSRIRIEGNRFEQIDGAAWGGAGHFLTIGQGAADVVVDGNVVAQTGKVINAYGQPMTGFVFTNNRAPHNRYGIHGDGQAPGEATIRTYFPGGVFRDNMITM